MKTRGAVPRWTATFSGILPLRPVAFWGLKDPLLALLYTAFLANFSHVGEGFASDPFCSWPLPF